MLSKREQEVELEILAAYEKLEPETRVQADILLQEIGGQQVGFWLRYTMRLAFAK
jgi:hypothetical protein